MFLSIFIASNVLLMLIYSCVATLLSRHLPRDGGAMLLHVLGEPAGRSKIWENTDASSRGFWWPLVEQTNIYQLTSYKLWVEKISKIKTIVCFAVLCQLWEVSFHFHPACRVHFLMCALAGIELILLLVAGSVLCFTQEKSKGSSLAGIISIP